MGQLGSFTFLFLALIVLLHNSSAGTKGSSGKKPPTKTSSSASSNKHQQGSKTQAKYPRQPNTHTRAGGGYSAGGSNPAGGYPVRTAGQPGENPWGYPATGGLGPNWNPNNNILSPRYGGGFGGTGYGIGGSPFSKSVHQMGYQPSGKSKGFAKKAMLAAGVGALTGVAVGYGLGQYPRPHFKFKSHQEEYYYNSYMHHRYGIKSTDTNNYARDYAFMPPPEAQTYEKYMNTCMNRSDLLQNQGAKISTAQGYDAINGSHADSERNITAENGTSEVQVPVESQESNDDTVSITEIGYPSLIQQVKVRKCIELYMVYSESFLQKLIQPRPGSHSDPPRHPKLLVLVTAIMSLGSTYSLQ